MCGVDITAVKELLGHSDIKTTQIDAQVSADHLRTAVSQLKYAPSTPENDVSGMAPQGK
jgi:site-specific recombinase XerD